MDNVRKHNIFLQCFLKASPCIFNDGGEELIGRQRSGVITFCITSTVNCVVIHEIGSAICITLAWSQRFLLNTRAFSVWLESQRNNALHLRAPVFIPTWCRYWPPSASTYTLLPFRTVATRHFTVPFHTGDYKFHVNAICSLNPHLPLPKHGIDQCL